MQNMIEGKVVLVTGGAGGIGSATINLLADKGAAIAVADIDRARLDRLVSGVIETGATIRGYDVDVTHKKDVAALVGTVLSDFSKIDVLINSAGIMLIRPMQEAAVDEWETIIDLNIKGTLNAIGAVLPFFLKQGRGHIVNLGSVHGLKVFSPGGAVHSGSKFAIRAISEGLRSETGGNGIRVTNVSPGAVNSGIQNKTTGADSDRIKEIYKTAISPVAVARAICFALEQPEDVSINEIVIRPTQQVI